MKKRKKLPKILEIKKFDTDGLPGGVWYLLQDRQDYLWLGTSVEKDIGTGLCRYDGKRFTSYTTEDGLADNEIKTIFEDRYRRLWFGTPDGGVSCYDRMAWGLLDTRDGQNPMAVLVPLFNFTQ